MPWGFPGSPAFSFSVGSSTMQEWALSLRSLEKILGLEVTVVLSSSGSAERAQGAQRPASVRPQWAAVADGQ